VHPSSGIHRAGHLTGFASRTNNISVYLTADVLGQDELLSKLGKHKIGKGCLYVSKLSDLDLKVLEQLVAGAFAERKIRYG
jgi:hypothetical protein